MRKSERKRLSSDGLPIDPKDWTVADWKNLYEGMERVKVLIKGRHARKINSLLDRVVSEVEAKGRGNDAQDTK